MWAVLPTSAILLASHLPEQHRKWFVNYDLVRYLQVHKASEDVSPCGLPHIRAPSARHPPPPATKEHGLTESQNLVAQIWGFIFILFN